MVVLLLWISSQLGSAQPLPSPAGINCLLIGFCWHLSSLLVTVPLPGGGGGDGGGAVEGSSA